ncbi:hypothetical protein WEH80_01955 [Actinomycetes bacterium KLBMP 9759]
MDRRRVQSRSLDPLSPATIWTVPPPGRPPTADVVKQAVERFSSGSYSVTTAEATELAEAALDGLQIPTLKRF